jgi:serine/threonine protein kinase
VTRPADALLTNVGGTLGTIAYMSPEQLRGLNVDLRTDLFSLGLVLYEVVTAMPAFGGATTTAVSDAILHEPAPRLRGVRADAPERLEQIVLKALEKDRDERYQTAADLRADLRRLKREIETEPSPVGEIVAAGDGNRARAGISDTRRMKFSRTIRVTVPVVAVVAIGLYVLSHREKTPSPATTLPARQELTIEQLTTSGRAQWPAISPGGRYVAYVQAERRHRSLLPMGEPR